MASQSALSLRNAYAFFAPLILMTELNMISKSAIHAFLARGETPGPTLAAFNTSFTFYYAMVGVTEVTAPLALAFLEGRRDLGHLLRFMLLVLTLPLGLVALIAFTTVGDWFYGEVFNLSRQGQAEARLATAIFMLSAPVLLVRGIAFALLMRHRRTLLITWSTLVRLLSLGVSLLLWPALLDGAAVGAAALVTCMASEAVFAWCFVGQHLRELRAHRTAAPPFGALWRFSWPLMLNQSSETGVVFVINLFLGRLHEAELALAAFGVAHGLAGLLLGPLRNLANMAQTLVTRRVDVDLMLRFTVQLVAILATACAVLFFTPLNEIVLGKVMGLGAELTAYCAPAMQLAVAMTAFWAFAALFRGLLQNARMTRTLALSGAMRIATAALIAALAALAPGLNGAVLGLGAWIASYAVESAITGTRLRQLGWFVPRPRGAGD